MSIGAAAVGDLAAVEDAGLGVKEVQVFRRSAKGDTGMAD